MCLLSHNVGRICFCGVQSRKNALLAKAKKMTIGRDPRAKEPKGENAAEQGVIAAPNNYQPKNVYKKRNLNLSHYLCFLFL